MSEHDNAGAIARRGFLSSAMALSGVAAAGMLRASPAAAASRLKSLDPVDPDIYYGTTGAYFGGWPNGALKMSSNMAMMLADVKHYGLQGFEPYSGQVVQYLGNPMALKQLADEAGVPIIDIGDLARAPTPGAPRPRAGADGPYPWLGGEGNAELISDMVSFARDFLQPLGCDHWKTNMGPRPPGGPSEDQLKRLAETLNEIGRQTIDHGVRLSPHPHIWGPMEREHDLRTVMDNTDPRHVWMILDTGHNVLGGMDPAKIAADYFPRISELHLKDTFAQYRGNTSTPTPEQHRQKSLYTNLGGGGVDFPAVFKVLRDRHFKGWAVFDIDAPRAGDGTGSVDDNMKVSINYLRDTLHVKLPPPPDKGMFTEG
ncbi:MAG TPA: sugar phosphate isomerase/epimerase family protein [Rhizomicrobium sp.]|nr:sugar phosphate isomerase/epimerase family protein [Rhizomicrobium sp.]